jgi:predicted acylesterase/phospholipase RssA
MREQGQSPDEVRANELLQLATLGTSELRDLKRLERDLAVAGNDALARTVREKRSKGDRTLAIAALSGKVPPRPEMLALAKRLAEYKELGLARRIMIAACKDASPTDDKAIYAELFQKGALYTYKDPDMPAEWRLDRALEILGKAGNLATTTDSETLGLAGAIFKRKWEVDGQRQHLERSLFHYLKGYAQGAPAQRQTDVIGYLRDSGDAGKLDAAKDRGYCGINAAFVLDLLAHEEEAEAKRIGLAPTSAAVRRAEARLIREEVIRSVPPLRGLPDGEWLNREWWFYATIGEAYFGLGRYGEALAWLKTEPAMARLRVGFELTDPAGLDVPEWEYESTARQLARLARVQSDPGLTEEAFAQSDAGRALAEFLAGETDAVRSAFRGKFGLGLSGGGFRAALFHIGTLARLAELDLLRHVEVLSGVSGGSIIGAHYYLKLRHLLETKPDDEIEPSDYVRLVREIEAEFLEGVQRNIRMRVLAEWFTNLKLFLWPGYSRTLRVGELYERELFSRVKDGEEHEPRFLNKLRIHPKVGDHKQTDFHPRNHNWRRRNKVPTLVLNAACLNTGHNWQFTASFMGEPPMPINAEIDCNERMRRMYYGDAPDAHKQIRLGHAVAASSCVPGLFEPLALDGLYPDRNVRLVDGGVCDNQGIASLLEQDCTVLLVSDGSGQMESQAVPSESALGVPLRSNGILQARVREAQYGDVSARRRAWLLRGLLFVHLKQDLPGGAVAWKDCPPQYQVSDFERQKVARNQTSYGVKIEVQKQLAAVRTDLDSFNDAEAYALMASAYRITGKPFEGDKPPVEGPTAKEQSAEWKFLTVDPDLAPEGEHRALLEKVLGVSDRIAFKVWSLSQPLIALKWTAAVAAAVGVVFAFWRWHASSLIPQSLVDWLTLGQVGKLVAVAIGIGVLTRVVKALFGGSAAWLAPRVVQPRETLHRIAVGAGMSVFGFLIARLHLHVFDRMYLRAGKVDRFRRTAT